jgi:hypothetical protein
MLVVDYCTRVRVALRRAIYRHCVRLSSHTSPLVTSVVGYPGNQEIGFKQESTMVRAAPEFIVLGHNLLRTKKMINLMAMKPI